MQQKHKTLVNTGKKNNEKLITTDIFRGGGGGVGVGVGGCGSYGRASDRNTRRVRVLGAARDFSPRVSFQCGLSDSVRTAPSVQSRHQHQRTRQKSQTLAATSLPGHTKILHTMTGTGSAARATAVP